LAPPPAFWHSQSR